MKWFYWFLRTKHRIVCWCSCVMFFFLGGCKQPSKIGHVVQIDLEQKGMDETEFLKLVTDIRLIPLETPDSVLIHSYDKLYINEHGIYILDSREKTLFMFNPDGTFRSKLCRVGRAPGEYMELDDFKVGNDGSLFLYDGGMGNLYEYDLCGNFIQKTELVSGELFDWWKENYVVYSGNNEDYSLYVLDKKGKVLQSYLSTEDMPPFYVGSNGGMTQIDGNVFFAPPFDYTVYEVAGDSCVPRYTFDFLSANLTSDLLHAKDTRTFIERFAKFNGVIGLGKPFAYNQWFIFFGALDAVFFNMETEQAYVLNDLGHPLSTLSSSLWFGNEKGEIYTHITASNLIHGLLPVLDDYINDYPFLKPLKERKIQETDNDWIFVAKLKE